jgi:hypothetical protein
MDEQDSKQKDNQGSAPLPSVVALLSEAVSRHAEQGHWDQAEHFARQLLRVTVQARQHDSQGAQSSGRGASRG